MAEKSLVEEALLEAKAIEESVKKSAKEILPSILKKEINELVKESLEDEEIDMDSETLDITDDEMDMGPMGDMDMDSIELDLTASSDDEVLKVFKKMGPEDEVEVVKSGDNVTLTDGNEEYEIKNVSEGKQEEPIYEIELEDGGAKKDDQSATRSDYKGYKGTDKGYKGKTGSSHGDQGGSDYDDEMNEMKDEQMYEIELDDIDDFESDELEEASMGRSHAHGAKASSGSPKGLKKASVIPNKARYKKKSTNLEKLN